MLFRYHIGQLSPQVSRQGTLDLVMERLAEFTESQQVSRAKIQQAAIYPVVLFTLTLAILAGLLGYVCS